MALKIFLGADHNGFNAKNKLAEYLRSAGFEVVDDGGAELNPEDDFPVFAKKVSQDVLAAGPDARGILTCGSGQGMCMAANRYRGIRAVLGYDTESVRSARNDDDSNVLCLPVKVLEGDIDHTILNTFLNTPFANAPRFNRRIQEMDDR